MNTQNNPKVGPLFVENTQGKKGAGKVLDELTLLKDVTIQ